MQRYIEIPIRYYANTPQTYIIHRLHRTIKLASFLTVFLFWYPHYLYSSGDAIRKDLPMNESHPTYPRFSPNEYSFWMRNRPRGWEMYRRSDGMIVMNWSAQLHLDLIGNYDFYNWKQRHLLPRCYQKETNQATYLCKRCTPTSKIRLPQLRPRIGCSPLDN
jgi:hypothetical protein